MSDTGGSLGFSIRRGVETLVVYTHQSEENSKPVNVSSKATP